MAYFNNDWRQIYLTPAERFCQASFADVYTRAGSWDLQGSTAYVVRIQDKDTGKIQERRYVRQANALTCVNKHQAKGDYVVCYNDENMFCSEGFDSDLDDEDDDDQGL